ncbi:hypothetical protein Q7P37_007676 [Cladosporium fusiforme]
MATKNAAPVPQDLSRFTQHDEHRKLYQSYLEASNNHDIAGMHSFYAPNVKLNDQPSSPQGITAQLGPLMEAFPDWHWEVRNLTIDGDFIALHFKDTGTHRGEFQGIEATGRGIEMTEMVLYHVVDGKFAEIWVMTDFPALIGQIS